jgi:hypothetical protein
MPKRYTIDYYKKHHLSPAQIHEIIHSDTIIDFYPDGTPITVYDLPSDDPDYLPRPDVPIYTPPIILPDDNNINDTIPGEYMKGDVNGDGVVTKEDADLILQYVVGNINLSPAQLAAADVNNDGIVSAADAALIMQGIVDGTFKPSPPDDDNIPPVDDFPPDDDDIPPVDDFPPDDDDIPPVDDFPPDDDDIPPVDNFPPDDFPGVLKGDVDDDGIISANDANLILKYLVGKVTLTPRQLYAADVDNDGKVTALDASAIMQMLPPPEDDPYVPPDVPVTDDKMFGMDKKVVVYGAIALALILILRK